MKTAHLGRIVFGDVPSGWTTCALSAHPRRLTEEEAAATPMAWLHVRSEAERAEIAAGFRAFFDWLGGGFLLLEVTPDGLDPDKAELFDIQVSADCFEHSLSRHVDAFLREDDLPMALHLERQCLVVFNFDMTVFFHFPRRPFEPPPLRRLSFFPWPDP